MPKKKYFKIEQITKAEYFKQADAAGKPEEPRLVNSAVSGAMNIAPKTWLGFTEDDVLEVPLEDEYDCIVERNPNAKYNELNEDDDE